MAAEGESGPVVELTLEAKIGYSVCAGILILFAGAMSGLNLGMFSLDRMELEVRCTP